MSITYNPPTPLAGPKAFEPKGFRPPARLASFAEARAVETPLIEVSPAGPGDGTAALGFALAWAAGCEDRLLVWAGPDMSLSEDGAPCAEGFAQFGVALDRLICARAHTQTDALWVAEEALKLPGALVICTIAAGKKPLSLTASRRLLLAAEKSGARGLLLRFDQPSPSAAWMGWRIAAAPSIGIGRELGAPAFTAELARYRAGPAGQIWHVQWSAHERELIALDGDLAAASGDRSLTPRAARSG